MSIWGYISVAILALAGGYAFMFVHATLHEFGHYIAGTKLGLAIIDFRVGDGWRLFSFHHRGVNFYFNARPFDGKVRLLAWTRYPKRRWKYAVFFAAGPAVDFFMAALCYAAGFHIGFVAFLIVGALNALPLHEDSDGSRVQDILMGKPLKNQK